MTSVSPRVLCETGGYVVVRFWQAIQSMSSSLQQDTALQALPAAAGHDSFVQSLVLLSAAVSFDGSPTATLRSQRVHSNAHIRGAARIFGSNCRISNVANVAHATGLARLGTSRHPNLKRINMPSAAK